MPVDSGKFTRAGGSGGKQRRQAAQRCLNAGTQQQMHAMMLPMMMTSMTTPAMAETTDASAEVLAVTGATAGFPHRRHGFEVTGAEADLRKHVLGKSPAQEALGKPHAHETQPGEVLHSEAQTNGSEVTKERMLEPSTSTPREDPGGYTGDGDEGRDGDAFITEEEHATVLGKSAENSALPAFAITTPLPLESSRK